MLIAFNGEQGAGKTLSMSVLGVALSKETGARLYASYKLQGAELITSIGQMMMLTNSIVLLDEFWLTMDSRMWKDNVLLSTWIFQCRKRGMVVMYNCHGMDQIDLRVRNATDFRVVCENVKKGIWLHVCSRLGIPMRRYLIEEPSRFYSLYDTYAVQSALR